MQNTIISCGINFLHSPTTNADIFLLEAPPCRLFEGKLHHISSLIYQFNLGSFEIKIYVVYNSKKKKKKKKKIYVV